MSSVKNYSWSAAVFIQWEIVIIILFIKMDGIRAVQFKILKSFIWTSSE